MKHYLRYVTKYGDVGVWLTYHIARFGSIPYALKFSDACKVLQMHKIPYTIDMFEYFGKETYYIYIEKDDLKKISRILIGREL